MNESPRFKNPEDTVSVSQTLEVDPVLEATGSVTLENPDAVVSGVMYSAQTRFDDLKSLIQTSHEHVFNDPSFQGAEFVDITHKADDLRVMTYTQAEGAFTQFERDIEDVLSAGETAHEAADPALKAAAEEPEQKQEARQDASVEKKETLVEALHGVVDGSEKVDEIADPALTALVYERQQETEQVILAEKAKEEKARKEQVEALQSVVDDSKGIEAERVADPALVAALNEHEREVKPDAVIAEKPKEPLSAEGADWEKAANSAESKGMIGSAGRAQIDTKYGVVEQPRDKWYLPESVQSWVDRRSAEAAHKAVSQISVELASVDARQKNYAAREGDLKSHMDGLKAQMEQVKTDQKITNEAERVELIGKLQKEHDRSRVDMYATTQSLKELALQRGILENQKSIQEQVRSVIAEKIGRKNEERLAPQKEELEQVNGEIERFQTQIDEHRKFIASVIAQAERFKDVSTASVRRGFDKRIAEANNEIDEIKNRASKLVARSLELQGNISKLGMEAKAFGDLITDKPLQRPAVGNVLDQASASLNMGNVRDVNVNTEDGPVPDAGAGEDDNNGQDLEREGNGGEALDKKALEELKRKIYETQDKMRNNGFNPGGFIEEGELKSYNELNQKNITSADDYEALVKLHQSVDRAVDAYIADKQKREREKAAAAKPVNDAPKVEKVAPLPPNTKGEVVKEVKPYARTGASVEASKQNVTGAKEENKRQENPKKEESKNKTKNRGEIQNVRKNTEIFAEKKRRAAIDLISDVANTGKNLPKGMKEKLEQAVRLLKENAREKIKPSKDRRSFRGIQRQVRLAQTNLENEAAGLLGDALKLEGKYGGNLKKKLEEALENLTEIQKKRPKKILTQQPNPKS